MCKHMRSVIINLCIKNTKSNGVCKLIMSKDSVEQTLRKSREVEERYKKFLQQKEKSDKQWAATEAKVENTLSRLAETKDTIKKIDEIYQAYQKSFENAINAALSKIQANQLIETAEPGFVAQHGTPKQVAELIMKKKKVLFMTGAGISAASGIPTFRDKDGYWTKKKLENVSPEEFLTMANFNSKPFDIWGWLEEFYVKKQKCKPNKGHVCIDIICNKLVNKKSEACIVTQNIDNFHVESRSSSAKQKVKYPVYEVHGNILKVRCDNCAQGKEEMVCFPYADYEKQIKSETHPKCPKCKSNLRPHIMFFDEFYEQRFHKSDSVYKFLEETDLLIVIGTALQTGLARKVVEHCLAKKIDMVEMNTECIIKHKKVIWMEGKSDELLAKINDYL